AEADSSPIVCLTGDNNFRFGIAKTKPYKDRPSRKPYHYKNILAYGKCRWEAALDPLLEADDLLSLEIGKNQNAICCSRDKDLLQSPGWHFQWECNRQPQFGPFLVEGYGDIHL